MAVELVSAGLATTSKYVFFCSCRTATVNVYTNPVALLPPASTPPVTATYGIRRNGSTERLMDSGKNTPSDGTGKQYNVNGSYIVGTRPVQTRIGPNYPYTSDV